MQVIVKTSKAKIKMEGDIPNDLLNAVNKAFKKAVRIFNDEGEEIVLATESDWFKKIEKEATPGKVINIYRENLGLSQAELGKKIGKSIQYISDLENARRNVSIDVAKQLAAIFDISIVRLIK
jgi:DNA-binding XRE family transcriptional regulator